MKFKIINKQKSIYDYDILWQVDQDLEHLTVLHKNTNHKVEFIYIVPSNEKENHYKEIKYITFRKVFCFIIKVETIRKIINNKIFYFESHNYCNSKIKVKHEIQKKKNFNILKDVIEIDAPFYLYLLRYFITKLVKRHLFSQFIEDESYRKRLQDLKNKNILKDYRYLNTIPIKS